jgi:hypothetical protein
MKVYGWDAVKLSEAYSLDELAQLRDVVTSDPVNANPDHAKGKSIYLYTKSARKKLEAIGYAIYYKLDEKSRAQA